MRGRIAHQKQFVRICPRSVFGIADDLRGHRLLRRFRPRAQRSGMHGTRAIPIVAIACCCLTSCASVSHHQFSEPAAGWQTKTGQLMYRTAKATLIGEAIVRLSKTGDFELTVSKGPGITLLSLRQDADFAEFNASFTASVGLVPRRARRHSSAAGSRYVINSFAHRIKKRCDTSATARLFCSVFETGFPLRTADATRSDPTNTAFR